MRVPPGEVKFGTVAGYDDAAGYGELVDAAGERWWFHCTAIADGTRTIEVGTRVTYDVVPGRRGQWEAQRVTEHR